MAYTDAQKKGHITDLQSYLHIISAFSGEIPIVIPDGIYGAETAAAVRAFQRMKGLPETGEADSETWSRLVKICRRGEKILPKPCRIFPSGGFAVENGDEGDKVYLIQAKLGEIGRKFDNMPKIEACGRYNDETEKAVEEFQRHCGVKVSGKVDSETWNMMMK